MLTRLSRPRRSPALIGLAMALTPLPAFAGAWDDIVTYFTSPQFLDGLKSAGLAIAVLFVGWILARGIKATTFALLCKTDVDNRIAAKLGLDHLLASDDPAKHQHRVERFFSAIVYYALLLFVVLIALDVANLGEAGRPISGLLTTVVGALPFVGKAVLILGFAYLAGTVLSKLVVTVLTKLKVDSRFNEVSGVEGDNRNFSESAGALIFWLIMLVGLAGASESLGIQAVADPLSALLGQIVALLPALGAAAVTLLIGFVVGRIASAVVSNLLRTFGLDELIGRVKLDRFFKTRKASDVVGLVVFAFILLHAFVAAFDRLGLTVLSAPISRTAEKFWEYLPALAVSALILAVGIALGRLARAIISDVLTNIGLDAWLARLGLSMSRLRKGEGEADAEGAAEGAVAKKSRLIDTPSELLGTIAQVAVVLVAVVQVLQNLKLDVWAGMVQGFLSFTLLNAVVALAIIGVGFAVGNYVRDLITAQSDEDDAGRRWVALAARMTVLVFAFTMAIQQLEVAPVFVLLTFGLLFGALCLALALAFGLGAREVASDLVRKQYDKARGQEAKGGPLAGGKGPFGGGQSPLGR